MLHKSSQYSAFSSPDDFAANTRHLRREGASNHEENDIDQRYQKK